MKRVSIYNEKGGVGKTTVTSLLAGYLAYIHGRKVCVLDFDYPTFHLSQLRRDELHILTNPKSPLAGWMRANPDTPSPYSIFRVPMGPTGQCPPEELFSLISNITSCGYDYLFYDFPGRFTPSDPVSILAANGLIDFVSVPMDTDQQSRRSALLIAEAMHRHDIAVSLFWNRVTSYEAHSDGRRFRRGAEPFLRRGLDVMEEMVRENKKLSRDASEMAFIRSTLCFPLRYITLWNPSLIPFVDALAGRINDSKTLTP